MSKILLLGDFCLKDKLSFGKNFQKIIKEIDGTILNFEGYFETEKNVKTLGMDLNNFLEVAHFLKIKAVSLANNHVNDNNSLEKTKELLTKYDLEYFGTEEKKFYEDEEFIIYGLVWKLTGGNQKKLNKFYFDMSKIDIVNEKNKKIIFFPHWGVELEKLPHPWQVIEIYKIIDRYKIDLVCGHHTHLKSINMNYKETPVIYSLGNFYMPSIFNTSHYPLEANRGIGIIYDTKTNKIEEITFETNVKTNEIEIYQVSEIKYFLAKNREEYKKFFAKKRTKKNLPIFTDNKYLNYIKALYNLFLINVFKLMLVKKIWYFLKKRREK